MPQIGSSFLPLWYHVAQRRASPPPEWCAQAGLPQRNTSGSRAQRTLNMLSPFTVFGLQRTSLCIKTDSIPVLCPLLQTSYIFSQHSFTTLFGGGAAWYKMSRLCCISFIWQCSRKCGSGLRKRTVLCTSTKPGVETRTLPDSLCAGLPKPGSQESCFLKRCQKLRKVQWFVSTWQEVCVKKRTVRNKHYSKKYLRRLNLM